MGLRRCLVVGASAGGLVACTLTTSLDGLAGPGPDGANPDGDSATASDGPSTDARAGDGIAPADDGSASGLVAYWSFDEGGGTIAHDSSGHGNDGTLTGGASWASGKVGRAIAFDGAGGHVLVGQPPSLDLTAALTVAMWINVDDVVADQMRLISKEGSWDVKLNGKSPQWESANGYAEVMAVVEPNVWHHVALTFANGTVHTFINGIERPIVINKVTPNAQLPKGTTLRIGAYETSTMNFTKGRLDEVRVYDHALTAAEIAILSR